MQNYRIAVLKGDGIGPEIVEQAQRVLSRAAEKFSFAVEYAPALLGGCAIDAAGTALPQETIDICKASDAVLLGAVIGAMLAFDMGGPVNKVAYLFAVASLTSAAGTTVPSVVMGAAGCSGMTISTSCALATILFPKKFSEHLKDSGKAALIMGMSFIAEGAIPFAIEHPKEVIPSIMTGAAVAGGLAGLFKLTLSAPIGGIFTLPLTSNILLYLLCFIIGTLVSTFMMGALLKNHVEEEVVES